ncbi:hypothetical protein SEA_JUICYJAY_83 [Mycobacterium phage JuicyJay]|nr:hypothetical protein SEA_KALAH2_79 [Mycobacterium phage Kalah2]UEM46570.1 hypothetical protein SEA_JUICYJAY_83 [Mycobacterium phage JuicyJay]
MGMEMMFTTGANWTDGKRNVVIEEEYVSRGTRAFVIRNLETDRKSRIELPGLTRKFNYVGHDPNYTPKGP